MAAGRPTMLVTGAAGFIGSHLVDRLLDRGVAVIGIDNLVRGTLANLASARDRDFTLIQADLADEKTVLSAVAAALSEQSIDTVWHLAANSDIPAGVADPHVDQRDTFATTFNVLLLMRQLGIGRIAFASTSAIYGYFDTPIAEDSGPLLPISNYGAFKLASEGLISAAAEAYLSRAVIYRFPNVIGARGTHGVIFDLLGKLKRSPSELEVLGDGTQQKPYLHVAELVDAMLYIFDKSNGRVDVFNIGPEDDGARVVDIADEVLCVTGSAATMRFTGGDRGWVGDVPRFQYSTAKLARLGWRPRFSSREAVRQACLELAAEHGFECKP